MSDQEHSKASESPSLKDTAYELRTKPLNDFVYAKKGERSCCENGHYLSTAAQDWMVGQFATEDDFADFAEGASIGMTACPVCGGAVKQEQGFYWFEV